MTLVAGFAYNRLVVVTLGAVVQINVAQLLKEPIGSTRNYEVNGVVDVAASGVDSTVQGEVSLVRTDRGILVKGTLNTEVEVICGRCLSLFRYPLMLNIQEEYFPTVDVVSGTSVALPDEPGSFAIDEYHMLDLTEAVRQYALLAIPIKPLCRQGCTGLCPTCGHNLNLQSCGCSSEQVDPRWAVLTELASERKGTR
ncbi:DUF177 domain-containing protein [Chloroflexota bacterium]